MMSNREVLSTHVYGRLGLSEDLNSLPEPQFEQLIFALHLPQGIIPPTTAPQGQRTSALLTWAESLQGPGLHEVKNTLNQILGRSISEIEGICPYKGLSFFDFNDQDARHFHGRVELTQTLLDKVKFSSFVAIVGASGSGKSSVLRAGLLYQLYQQGDTEIRILVPGEKPLHNLALAFVDKNLSRSQQAVEQGKAEELIIQQGADGLRRLIQSSLMSKMVLVIDQFEEVFTLCKNESERRTFFATLLGALEQIPSKLCLVLAMRSDFLGKCYDPNYKSLAKQVQNNQIVVLPLDKDELFEVIIRPAQQVGLKIEPELVKQLLVDVENSPGSLPLLQYTLKELWEHRQNNTLKLNTYAELGGVTGTLKQRADSFYNQLDLPSKRTVEFIFLSLTQPGDHTEPTRRQVSKQDLISSTNNADVIDLLIKEMADANLIVTENLTLLNTSQREIEGRIDPQKPTNRPMTDSASYQEDIVINVAHEALIRHWPRLQEWLKENEDRLRIKQKIEKEADRWLENQKSENYLAKDSILAIAKDFVNSQAENNDSIILKPKAQDFVRFSIEEEQRKIEEEQRKIEEEQRKKNYFLLLAVVGLLTSVASIVLINRGYEVNRSRKLAEQSQVIFNFQQIDGLSNAINAGKIQQRRFVKLFSFFSPFKDTSTQVTASLRDALFGIRQISVLQAHASSLDSVAASPDGQTFASGDSDGLIKIWKMDKDNAITPVKTIQAHIRSVKSLNFSPDIEHLISSSSDGTIKIWKSQGEFVATLLGHSSEVSKIIVSPDSQFIVSASYDGTIKFWSIKPTKEGKHLIGLLQADQGILHDLAFNSDGSQLASAGESGTVKIWDAASKKLLKAFNSGNCNQSRCDVYSVSFSNNSGYLATVGANPRLQLWNIQGNPEVTEIGADKRHTESIRNVKFTSRLGQELIKQESDEYQDVLVTSSEDNSIGFWFLKKTAEGKTIEEGGFKLKGHDSNVNSIAFSHDGNYLFSGGQDSTLRIWNGSKKTSFPIPELAHDQPGDVKNSFSAHGSQGKTPKLVTADQTGRIILWFYKIKEGEKELKWHPEVTTPPDEAHKAGIWDVSFTPSGDEFATVSENGSIKFWSAKDASFITEKSNAHDKKIGDISFSQNDNGFATAGADGRVKVWEWDANRKLVETISIESSNILPRVALSSDGKKLAVKASNHRIQLWEFKGREWTQYGLPLQGHVTDITTMSFSPNGKRLVSGSEDGVIKVWNSDGTFLRDLHGHLGIVNHVSFSPDNSLMASVSSTGEIIIWNIWSGSTSKLYEFSERHFNSATGISFSPDGKQIASSSADGRTLIWELDLDYLMENSCSTLRSYLDSSQVASSDIRETCNLADVNPAMLAEHGTLLARQGDQDAAIKALLTASQQVDDLGPYQPEELAKALTQIPKAMEDARQSIIDNLEDNKPSARDVAISKFDEVFRLLGSISLLSDRVFEPEEEVDRLTALAIAGISQKAIETLPTSENSLDYKDPQGFENSEQEMIDTILASYKRAKVLFPNMEKTLVLNRFDGQLGEITWHDSAQEWHKLCRLGSRNPGVDDQKILAICDLAVALNLDNGSIQDSRAMAKLFLQKNIPAAIADFDAFLEWLNTETAIATYSEEKRSEWRNKRQQCRDYLVMQQAQFDNGSASYDSYNPAEAPDFCQSFDFQDGYKRI